MVSSERVNASEYFRQLQRLRFVVSPAGNGLDSHSTWEALMAGCIPIVAHSPLDPLYADLPVWLVDDWSEVTDAAVRRQAAQFKRMQWNFDKIYSPWWRDALVEEERSCNQPLGAAERRRQRAKRRR